MSRSIPSLNIFCIYVSFFFLPLSTSLWKDLMELVRLGFQIVIFL